MIRSEAMPSPFPGMNPFFEEPGAWEMFHAAYITNLLGTLAPRLPPGYFCKSAQLVFLLEPSAEERGMAGRAERRRPDTFVGAGSRGTSPAAGTVVAAAAAPTATAAFVFPDVVEERHRFLEIRRHFADRRLGELVTVIEVLSPSNKAGGGRSEYLAKRRELLDSEVNVLEIDLLRGGGPVAMDPEPEGDYRVALARPERRPRVEVWAWTLREPMPSVPVPLKPADGQVPLDLQAALHGAHDQAGFAAWLYDHGTALITPPLSPEDAAWAEELAATVRR